MVGLVAAVEWYLGQDHAAHMARCEAIVQLWLDALPGMPGVVARRDFPNEAGRPVPRALIMFDPAACGVTGDEVRRRLWEHEQPVAVAPAAGSGIYLTPDTLEPGEEEIIVARLRAILAG
jgi:L-seryl-tRNA(Ser) seleniumtransferase